MYSGSIHTVYLVMISSPSYKSKLVKHFVVLMLQLVVTSDVVTRGFLLVTRALMLELVTRNSDVVTTSLML